MYLVKMMVFSAVTNIWREPVAGWTDNFNGPTGLLIGGAKGVVRSVLTKVKDAQTFDMVPVDTVVKVMCISAWLQAKSR